MKRALQCVNLDTEKWTIMNEFLFLATDAHARNTCDATPN